MAIRAKVKQIGTVRVLQTHGWSPFNSTRVSGYLSKIATAESKRTADSFASGRTQRCIKDSVCRRLRRRSLEQTTPAGRPSLEAFAPMASVSLDGTDRRRTIWHNLVAPRGIDRHSSRRTVILAAPLIRHSKLLRHQCLQSDRATIDQNTETLHNLSP
jgi:hypothetical protein